MERFDLIKCYQILRKPVFVITDNGMMAFRCRKIKFSTTKVNNVLLDKDYLLFSFPEFDESGVSNIFQILISSVFHFCTNRFCASTVSSSI